MNGKGSRPRPVDLDKYGANYDTIFKKPLFKSKATTTRYPVSKRKLPIKGKDLR